MVLELIGPALVRVAGNTAIRAYLAQNPDVVDQAIRLTCQEETEVEIEQALRDWSKSAPFFDMLDRFRLGERNVSDETVRSFVEAGDFFLPDPQDQRKTAQRIVMTFLGQLEGALLRGDDSTVIQTNRIEQLHEESENRINRHTDLQIERLSTQLIAALQANTAGDSQGGEGESDPQHAAISTQIDSARDLFHQGKVRSARSLLGLLEERQQELTPEQEFRLSINLGVCELALDNEQSASSHFAQALKLQPNSPLALGNASVAARLQGDLARAEALAREALAQAPEDSQAGAALIEVFHARDDFEQIEETLHDMKWMIADDTCRLTIARVWTDQRRFDDALELCNEAMNNDPLDVVARLTMAHCLLSAAQVGKRRDAPEQCREVVELSNETWRLLQSAELEQPRLQVLTVRGAALAMLGSVTGALADFNEILRRAPGDSIALLNSGLALCSVGRFSEGSSAFELISDPRLREQVVLPHAVACMASGRPTEAVRILRGSYSLDGPTWEDIRRSEMLCEAERAAGSEDTVSALLSGLHQDEPDDPLLTTLAGSIALSRYDTKNAETHYLRALELVDDRYRSEILWRLANCYVRQDRYSEAAELTKEVVNGDVAHEGAIPLLLQLRNSGDVKGALDWARSIGEGHPEPPKFALLTEADVLTFLGDAERAANCWRDICERVDASNCDLTNYAQALLRTGSREDAKVVLQSIEAEDLRDDPPSLLRLASLKMLLGEGDFLEDAYTAWRYGIGDPAIHLGYFSLFMSQNTVMREPVQVQPGSRVLLTDGSSEEWWHILDYGEERRGEKELLPTEEGAEAFLGHEVGDTVTLRDDVERRSWQVVAVQSKHVWAFQEIAAGFSTRFPSNRDLSSVPVDPNDLATLYGVVDERDRFVRDLEQLYRGDRVPFASMCALLQRPAPEVWRACTSTGSLRVRFAGGSEWEAQRAAEWLNDASMVVLDMLSLLTAHELAIGDQLRRRFSFIGVPQSVIDEVRQMAFEVSTGAQPGGYVGRNVDGTYRWVELTDEQWQEHQEFAHSLLDFAESFVPVAAYPAAEAEYESVQQLREVLTDAGAGAIFAGDEDASSQPLLVADDFGLGELANAMGTPAVNSQAVLRELRRSGVISALDYSLKIAELAKMNYRFVRIDAADLQRLLEANGYITDERTMALASTLEGPECTKDSAVVVISTLIADLATRSLPVTQETLLVSMFLGHLQRGRETTTALRECRAALEALLPLGAPLRERTLTLVGSYIDVVNA